MVEVLLLGEVFCSVSNTIWISLLVSVWSGGKTVVERQLNVSISSLWLSPDRRNEDNQSILIETSSYQPPFFSEPTLLKRGYPPLIRVINIDTNHYYHSMALILMHYSVQFYRTWRDKRLRVKTWRLIQQQDAPAKITLDGKAVHSVMQTAYLRY